MLRLFISTPIAAGNFIGLSSDHSHYLRNVMHCSIGDEIYIFNSQQGEWVAKISDISKRSVILNPVSCHRKPSDASRLWLYFAPPKPKALSNIVRQATELNVSVIQPILSQYTVNRHVNTDRMRSIAIEASEQSNRIDVPDIKDAINISDILNHKNDCLFVFCDETHSGVKFADIDHTFFDNNKNVVIIVGPEGGFSDMERELFAGIDSLINLDLGNTILKCDTAVVSAISIVSSIL